MVRSFFPSYPSFVLCDQMITFLKTASQQCALYIKKTNLQELQISEN